jgi:hypothetical protein
MTNPAEVITGAGVWTRNPYAIGGIGRPGCGNRTWFEFAPADDAGFDELVAMLRATDEWGFVEREVDIRLDR